MNELIQKAKDLALIEIKQYGNPSLLNFDIANEKGQWLAEQLGADKDIVLLGTTLMDLKLGQALSENKIKEHVKMSVETVQTFLEENKVDEDLKEKVLDCVRNHHGIDNYPSLEAKICANADCYRFIYPKNVFSSFADVVKEGMSLDEALAFSLSKLEEKHNALSLDLAKNELEEYYQMFKKMFEVSK